MKNKIMIITGIFGDVASYLANYFNQKDFIVFGLSRSIYDNPPIELDYIIPVDLLCEADVLKVFQNINEVNPIDILINTAGGFSMGKDVENNSEEWKEMLDINFRTALNCCKAALPIMKDQNYGRIINFGSATSILPTAAPYLVGKSAVHALTTSIASELYSNITCNAILPGVINTPKNKINMPDVDQSGWVSCDSIVKAINTIIGSNTNGELLRLID